MRGRPGWWHDMKRYQRNKEPGVLVGVKSIRRYMQIGPNTFYTFHRVHGLLCDAATGWPVVYDEEPNR